MICQRRLKPNFRGPGPDGQRRRSILLRGLCAAAGPLLMFKAGQPVLRENLSGFICRDTDDMLPPRSAQTPGLL